MSRAMTLISGAIMPRVVTAAVPMRTPEATIGELVSKGIVFLLTVIAAASSAFSADLAGQAAASDVHQEEVIVGAARNDAKALRGERRRERRGVGDDLRLVGAKSVGERLAERHRLGGDDVHQRTALETREDRAVDLLGVLRLAHHHPAARTAQRLVGRRGHEMAMRHRRGMKTGGDQSGDVRDVGHEERAGTVGDLAKAREVDRPAVGRGAADDQLRTVLERQALDLVVVDALGLAIDAVGDDVEVATRIGEAVTVGEVPAAGEIHPHQGVARAEHREVDGGVRRGAGVRLDVGVLGAEELLQPLDRQGLDPVDHLAATVVAAARDSPRRTCW